MLAYEELTGHFIRKNVYICAQLFT